MGKMTALNRAFEKAFAHTATKETLYDLLACLGEELSCDRIAVFEYNIDGTIDNTHEWCRQGMQKEQGLLQGIRIEGFHSWKKRLEQDEIIRIPSLETIRRTDPDTYDFFSRQDVESVIISKLAFHGGELGFFVLENPDKEMLDETEIVLPGMRYILSSLVYSDQLIHRLEKIGFKDRLTGTGNRMSLQEHLEELDPKVSIGIIYCEVVGWEVEDNRPEHLQDEQKLLHAGRVLRDVYEESEVFRVGVDEFLVVVTSKKEQDFDRTLSMIRHLFAESDLLVAIGHLWKPYCDANFDSLIRMTHLLVFEEKKKLLKNHARYHEKAKVLQKEKYEHANITLPRGDDFFRLAELFLAEIFDQPVMTGVLDINYFKLYNDIFGRRAGNRILEDIADSLKEQADLYHGIAGYLGGDNFCLMLPIPYEDTLKLKDFMEERFREMKYADGFMPAIGIYLSYNREETMITMYDRALTALAEIKGSYMEHFRFYEAGHFEHLKEDKLLLMDLRRGLQDGEFTFYLQPQVHEKTGKIIGAEALVRWRKGREMISPSRFIPLLEKTGYIFEVDCFVWESVVKWLKSLIERGISPVPCSVNVSRMDFYFTDIADHFIGLLNKYDLKPEYLGVEITESAFTDNTESILEAVNKLHDAGFRILMDDFGSGSSSLSMLHTMDLDVLKTDVRFMSKKAQDNRAVSIVEAVITMAHMIGMMVVTEGVETTEQRDNLIAMGDNYAQGFLFYRPMPVEQFEKLLRIPDNVGRSPKRGDKLMTNHLCFRNMIQEGMVSDTLLDNIIGAAAVYREADGHFSLVQVNDQFTELTGLSLDESEKAEHYSERYQERELDRIMGIFHGADVHPLEGSKGNVKLYRADGNEIEVEARIFLLFSSSEHKLYLATIQERA